MSDTKKKKRKHKVRAVNPEAAVTSTSDSEYPQSTETRKLKARLLR